MGSTYLKGKTLIESIVTHVTSGGTTSLLFNDETNQQFTGTNTQIVRLPDATTCNVGRCFKIYNQSTNTVSVNDNGSNPLQSLVTTSLGFFCLLDNSTANGVWAYSATSSGGGGGGGSFDFSSMLDNLGLSTSVASNNLTIALKQGDGTTNPGSGSNNVSIGFRSSSITSGAFFKRTVSSALSVVLNSGSTIGHQSGVNRYIYVYALDNAGTVALGVSSAYYEDGSIVSTVAEGGGTATSNSNLYTSSAISNVPSRLIGLLVSNQSTAGVWASNVSSISLRPFDIPANETKAYLTGNISGTTNSVVTLNATAYDTHGSLNTATGEYKCNFTGLLEISGLISLSAGNAGTFEIYKNGAAINDGPSQNYFLQQITVNNWGVGIVKIKVSKDDLITVINNTNGTTILAINSYVMFKRIFGPVL